LDCSTDGENESRTPLCPHRPPPSTTLSRTVYALPIECALCVIDCPRDERRHRAQEYRTTVTDDAFMARVFVALRGSTVRMRAASRT
jgi:hypothetical protein